MAAIKDSGETSLADVRKIEDGVETVDLSKPMSWAQYKSIEDESLRAEYLRCLRDKHHGSQKDIAAMFGVVPSTVSTEADLLNVRFTRQQQEDADRTAWTIFTAGYTNPVVHSGTGRNYSRTIETDMSQVMVYDRTPSITEMETLVNQISAITRGHKRVEIRLSVEISAK